MIDHGQLWFGILVVAPTGTLFVLAVIAAWMRWTWRRR